jgi:predicted TIM-barrel fold metal-dependent hydrolase
MFVSTASRSTEIRARLDHPVIDCDGHLHEMSPLVLEYLAEVGGHDLARRFQEFQRANGFGFRAWLGKSLEERRAAAIHVMPWWAAPTANTLDRATAMLPRLLRARMDEIGLDFSVLFPTGGLEYPRIEDPELRRASCRALNRYLAEVYGAHPDRMTPAAVVPMHTPEEAIAELEYAVGTLGLKAVMIAGYVKRPVTRPVVEQFGETYYIDTYGPESPHDYDPFWARCVELGVAPAAHAGGIGVGFRRSLWNFMYNHSGHFAASGEALCKSLFFAGVTHRFPALRVAFLECGVAWACALYAGLLGRWEKRNLEALRRNLDPARLDYGTFTALATEYGEERLVPRLDAIRSALQAFEAIQPEDPDDWRYAGIERAEDIRARFVPSFFFGCESDDPMNAWAFNTKLNPFGARLNAILSSDIGHWDVPDMREVLEEAYELVEREALTPDDFRDFAFTHPARLFAGANPRFFAGTGVEAAVAELLGTDAGQV